MHIIRSTEEGLLCHAVLKCMYELISSQGTTLGTRKKTFPSANVQKCRFTCNSFSFRMLSLTMSVMIERKPTFNEILLILSFHKTNKFLIESFRHLCCHCIMKIQLVAFQDMVKCKLAYAEDLISFVFHT